jgi:hypothetical protein
MERAVRLALAGWSLREIAQLVGTAHSTVADWQKMPEWTALVQRFSTGRADRLSYAAYELVTREFRRALEANRVEERTLQRAVRVLEILHRGTEAEDGRGSTFISGGVTIYKAGGRILLPQHDQGAASRPASEVLRARAHAADAQPAPATPRRGRTRKARRIVGPGES